MNVRNGSCVTSIAGPNGDQLRHTQGLSTHAPNCPTAFLPKLRAHASAPAHTILPLRVLTLSFIWSASLLVRCRQSFRKATLAIVAKASPGIRFNEHMEGDGPTVFAHACKMGLEGIVSKRKDSMYRSGRSPHWLKMKNPDAPAVKREAEEDWGR